MYYIPSVQAIFFLSKAILECTILMESCLKGEYESGLNWGLLNG